MSMSTELQDEVDLLAYLSGRQDFIDERNLMTTTQTKVGETLYYEYDLRRLPLTPLNRISVSSEHEMQDDPGSFLDYYKYKQISSPNEQVTLYRSTWASSEYLVVVQGFFVGCGGLIGTHPFQTRFINTAAEAASSCTGRTLGFERAVIAVLGIRAIAQ
jgi:hypothetical protein